jgi:hypothetical protein
MFKHTIHWIAVSAGILFLLGCAGSIPTGNPISPSDNPITASSNQVSSAQTHLWGYYDVTIDIPTQTATAAINRQAMFTANVVNFLNGKPPKLGFKINSTPIGSDFVDVDIDVTLTHPFAGLHQYDGYDVRGVFMGDGSTAVHYNGDLIAPTLGTDQYMLPDPIDGDGGPDGYTRWYNKTEFSSGGLQLFNYTPGTMASPNFNGTATLCPYKYFADGLGKSDDLFTWLSANASSHGVFTAGAANTRTYYLRFPNAKGVKYGYAVLANWVGTEPQYHPSNAHEAIAMSISNNSDVYYESPTLNGGDLNFDISLFDWDSTLSAGLLEDYKIFIESTVLNSVYPLSASEMVPVSGGENYSTFHTEIAADNIQSSQDNEYWVIVEETGEDYTNTFGITNLADTDTLAAFFRNDLHVSPTAPSGTIICDLQFVPKTPCDNYGTIYEFDASGSYDTTGATLSYSWDFNGDGVFGDPYEKGTDAHPFKLFNNSYNGNVCVRLSNGTSQTDCCIPVDITAIPSKNIPLRSGVNAMDIAVDHADGDLLIVYSDGQVWRYLANDHYQNPAPSGNPFFTSVAGVNHMDLSPNSYIVIGGNNDKTVSVHESRNPAGVLLFSYNDPNGITDVAGVTCHTSVFDYYNCHAVFSGWFDSTHDYWFNRWTPGNEYMSGASGWWADDVDGINGVNHNLIKGVEMPGTSENVYILEGGPQFTVESYSVVYYGSGWHVTVDHWGGVQSDGMDGFNDPQDITRDSSEHYYILDNLTTGPAIKEYTSTGTPIGEPFGGWGIKGSPLKIEGSDFVGTCGNLIFVISDGGSNPDMLSIFLPEEIG